MFPSGLCAYNAHFYILDLAYIYWVCNNINTEVKYCLLDYCGYGGYNNTKNKSLTRTPAK